MICSFKKLIKTVLCFILLLHCSAVKPQISLIHELIDKVEGYDNYSYQSIIKRRDMSIDTVVFCNKSLFVKAPDDKLLGYHYRVETENKADSFYRTDLYNGEGITILSASDSTFFSEKVPVAFHQSLLGLLKSIVTSYHNKPFKITLAKDTIIHGTANSHFVANTYDTVENKEHLYVKRDYYMNKQTGLPGLVIVTGRYKYGGVVNQFYDQTEYFDYKINQPGVTADNFLIPSGFKLRKSKATPALLAEGATAPDWTLYDANGKKVALSQLKGKVVMLDFYYIGCSGCMKALKPLNAIYEKYKNKGVIIASLTERDSKNAVLDFEKRNKIRYTGFINAADVVKSYHVTGFPTFYFIDKEGKIGNVFVGYNDDLEARGSVIIDKLLSEK